MLKTKILAGIVAIALTFPLTVVTASAWSKYLTGAEIKEILTGKSIRYWGKSSGYVAYTSTSATFVDGTWGSKTGSWWVSGNRFCRKYPDQDTKCYRIRRLGDGKYSGSQGYTWRIHTGPAPLALAIPVSN